MSGRKEAKGESRKSERRREGMRAMKSVIGRQRSRAGKIQIGVTPTEWVRDAWGKEMKHQPSSLDHPSHLDSPAIENIPRVKVKPHKLVCTSEL